ncbi:phytoene desaturase family protein [Priestia flexa]|uniref:phytoene desaturase family protein n=1 Tax=Priestia flexa TaxID=86664 RepID=UPI0024923312|nr:FAD-dependent oxidoreductase [Priestia flexa]
MKQLILFTGVFFENEKVINAFNRYATYIGSSPYVSPATFSLIGHLEMNEEVYYVQGGNPRIAEGFATVFQKAGGTLVLNEQVEKVQVKNKKAVGIKLENGEKLPADSIIVNGDLLQAYPFLVDEANRPHFTNKMVSKFEPSISAYVILSGTKNRNDSLIHHQVYFEEDYKREFYELFEKKQLPSDPTIYICNSSYTDRSVAPGDNLFILVNAPAGMSNDNGYEQVIYEKLKRFDIDITSTLSWQKVITPSWIEKQFGAYKGALYGISANRKMDSFLRPSNVSKDVRGLYFVGGTTHPGGGSPMVTISGINVANLIST